jgi:hypothetical protein
MIERLATAPNKVRRLIMPLRIAFLPKENLPKAGATVCCAVGPAHVHRLDETLNLFS